MDSRNENISPPLNLISNDSYDMIVGSMMLSNIGNLDTVNQVEMELIVKSNATCDFAEKEGEITCTRFCPLITKLIELALYRCILVFQILSLLLLLTLRTEK